MDIQEILFLEIKKINEARKDYWTGSVFEEFLLLSNDERGFFGESLIASLCNKIGLDNIWDENHNINQELGIYDMLINNMRVEVKTAMRGTSSNNWQHENLYKEKVWDKIIFVDIAFDGIYFTILDYSQMTFEKTSPIFNKKATLRKGQSDKWKFDFSLVSLNNGIKNNVTFYYDFKNINNESFENFFKERLRG